MGEPGERDRMVMRAQVRHALRQVVQEAHRQGCFEDVQRFPAVFVLFLVQVHPTIGSAFAAEMVTLQDLEVWLEVLVRGTAGDGRAAR